jgi:hypothetical protein
MLMLVTAAGLPAQVAPVQVVPGQPPGTPPAEPSNIRYEIRIVEEGGTQKPTTKTVSMIGMLYEVSIVRAQGGRNGYPLNVDVTPTDIRGGRIRTKLGIEFNPSGQGGGPEEAQRPPFIIRQTLHAWLENGKPMNVSQAVDPTSDRRVSIDVTATVIK